MAFSAGYEPSIECLELRAPSKRAWQGCDIQSPPDPSPATTDMRLSVMLAALPHEWRQTSQGGDLLAADLAELGQADNDAQRRPLADTRHALHKLETGGQIVILPHRREQAFAFIFTSLAQALDVSLGDTAQPLVADMLKAGSDPHNVFLELFNKSEVISQSIKAGIGRQFIGGIENMRAGGDEHGIDSVGFGTFEMQLGKGFDLHRLHHDDGETGFLEKPGDATFIAAGGFDADARHAGAFELSRRRLPAGLVIGNGKH